MSAMLMMIQLAKVTTLTSSIQAANFFRLQQENSFQFWKKNYKKGLFVYFEMFCLILGYFCNLSMLDEKRFNKSLKSVDEIIEWLVDICII